MEVIAIVHRNDQAANILLNTTDSLDYVYKAISAEFHLGSTPYILMYHAKNGNFQELTKDVLHQLMSSANKTIELFIKEDQDHEMIQPNQNDTLVITITLTPSLPVEQRTATLRRADLDEKFKRCLGLQQYFDVVGISTKCFVSEILSYDGTYYLEQYLLKNHMPITVREFIKNNLQALVKCNRNISDYRSSKNNESSDIIFKMKSKIEHNQLIVIIVYAIVDNEQTNLATSLVKKMIPNKLFNKGVEELLDEIIEDLVDKV
ncbi:hypothetical protein I4U23_012171 [Adineta vaga]|nr:hypothetical protein I4U23_012171 [Adineta vaga]